MRWMCIKTEKLFQAYKELDDKDECSTMSYMAGVIDAGIEKPVLDKLMARSFYCGYFVGKDHPEWVKIEEITEEEFLKRMREHLGLTILPAKPERSI